MKKVVISAAIAAALGAGSFAGCRALNPAERQLSDIELANVEALADPNEGGASSDTWDCWSSYEMGSGGAWICGNPCTLKDGVSVSKTPSGKCRKQP